MSFPSLSQEWFLTAWGMGGQCTRYKRSGSAKEGDRDVALTYAYKHSSHLNSDNNAVLAAENSSDFNNNSVNIEASPGYISVTKKISNKLSTFSRKSGLSSLSGGKSDKPKEKVQDSDSTDKIVSRDTTADDSNNTPVAADDVKLQDLEYGDMQDFVSTCSQDIKDSRPSKDRSSTSVGDRDRSSDSLGSRSLSTHFSYFGTHVRASTACASSFQVRNEGYKRTKEKVASQDSLYRFFGCDFVKADHKKIENIVENWGDDFISKLPTKKGWTPDIGFPEILVINCMCPYETGGMWGAHPVDDVGFNVLTYHKISTETLRAAAAGEESKYSKQLALFKRFIEGGQSERNGISLKKIGQATNVEELGLPGFIKGYNGKPVLVTASCHVIKSHYPRILEIDYDIRQWSYAMRSALPGTVFPRFKIADVLLGWLIEGKTEDELPEQMLACCRAGHFDVQDFTEVAGR